MADPSPLTPSMLAFLAAPRFATLATLDGDGSPRQAVAWYRLDPDTTVVVNSAAGRTWPANLRRDGRVALAVLAGDDGYSWLGMTGVVSEVIDDQAVAQADIAGLARRYHADDPTGAERLITEVFERQRRVSFRIRVTGVHDHLGG
ncbi:MAG: TIGR03618 family F420-dependent PPOX class oxidoreductase [Chloroflexi bacterium]|jgi:PPOX class probable F420-dependent enzyme|nr:TIGR03618 family F420-dependent PPOX class oxidoreductase [Chloroflexota bacterium]